MEETGMTSRGGPRGNGFFGGFFLSVSACAHPCNTSGVICVHLWLKGFSRTPTLISRSPITDECVTGVLNSIRYPVFLFVEECHPTCEAKHDDGK
ncbi:hypothetical protein IAD21_05055 [Abditibacteriota bacterium]|nr:hypothetical protein IAD21_05055 [Abditibacteriota bacterium]